MVSRPGAPTGGGGFSLVEIVVALVVLEIGLVAVAGQAVLAARALADAAELQRAMGSLEVVVDSLARVGSPGGGERLLPPHRVRWWTEGGVLRLRVERTGGVASPVVEADLPVGGG